MTTAFTIGNEHSYDQALAHQPDPVRKVGARPDDDPPYKGGCLWRTPEEAHEYIVTQGDALGFLAAVYEVQLPTGWDADVSPELSDDGPYHHLLNDADIVRKVTVGSSHP